MVDKELEKVNKNIERLNREIQALNDECALVLAKLAGENNSRILSFSQEEEINKTVESYTKKLAKLIVELEEEEEIKRILTE